MKCSKAFTEEIIHLVQKDQHRFQLFHMHTNQCDFMKWKIITELMLDNAVIRIKDINSIYMYTYCRI